MTLLPTPATALDLSDEDVVRRVLQGETALYEIIMRRYNQRLYRAAISITGEPSEAEDLIQDAYVKAFTHLHQYAGEAKFSTWLTRIAVHEALARSRKKRREVPMPDEVNDDRFSTQDLNPEAQAAQDEARRMLESSIQTLPPAYRSVFVLREIEGLSTAETASCLDINEEAVKVRLHRSRRMLRKEFYARSHIASSSAFAFQGAQCDATVKGVFERLGNDQDAVLRASSDLP